MGVYVGVHVCMWVCECACVHVYVGVHVCMWVCECWAGGTTPAMARVAGVVPPALGCVCVCMLNGLWICSRYSSDDGTFAVHSAQMFHKHMRYMYVVLGMGHSNER